MYGKRAHAMEPRNGINAIMRLLEFLNTIIEDEYISFIYENFKCSRLSNVNQNFTDPEMGDLTSNVALLNIKENKGSCGINFRYPINWDKELYFNTLQNEANKSNVTVKVLSDSKPHYIPKDHELVKSLHKHTIGFSKTSIISKTSFCFLMLLLLRHRQLLGLFHLRANEDAV